MLNKKQLLGIEGENEATNYLEKNDYSIITRNFNCLQGEIDIIARDNLTNEIVFVEVKTRKNRKYGLPIDAVNKIKQKHLVSAAKFYIYLNELYNEYIRFDVIEIMKTDKLYIKQIKNCQVL